MAKEFIPVNDLLERTSLEQFINHYSFDTQILRKGNEERIRNPFACEKCSGNNQAVSVNWKAAVFTSHCYHCSVRGRVTTLLFGMKYGRQPLGGKLKGDEFKDIAADIAQVAGHQRPGSQPERTTVDSNQGIKSPERVTEKEETIERKVNVPLARNPDERIARLVHLSDELIRDPEAMSGRAQAYLDSREYMTPETMEKWDVGYLPSNSRSMLRGKFVYALRNERSEKIGYVGRDLAFDENLAKWENSDRTARRPIKAKFPPGFVKGSFLFGGEAKRLSSENAKKQLQDIGIVVVEGMNDCIALDQHGVLSVAICGNLITDGQCEKLARWSREFSGGKITLMLDNDSEGFEGTKEAVAKLSLFAFVRSAWNPESLGGTLRGMQPENLSGANLSDLISP